MVAVRLSAAGFAVSIFAQSSLIESAHAARHRQALINATQQPAENHIEITGPLENHGLTRQLRQCESNKMEWLFILLVDVFEVVWPFALKWSAAFSRWSPLLAVLLFTPSAFLLDEAVKRLPAATVYAAFTGLATAATAIIGIVFYGESANPGRVGCLVLILIGVVGLKLFSGPG